MVDSMELPKTPTVEGAVHPITDEVTDDQDGNGLRSERQTRCWSEALHKHRAVNFAIDY